MKSESFFKNNCLAITFVFQYVYLYKTIMLIVLKLKLCFSLNNLNVEKADEK
jgi:hypothetical protein